MEVKVIKLPEFKSRSVNDYLYGIGRRSEYSIYKLNDEELAFEYEKPLKLPIRRYMVTIGDGSINIRCNGNDKDKMYEFIKRIIFTSTYDNGKLTPAIDTFDTEQECLDWIMQREISIVNLRIERFSHMLQEVKELGIGDIPEEYIQGYTEEETKEIREKYDYYKKLNDTKKNETVEVVRRKTKDNKESIEVIRRKKKKN